MNKTRAIIMILFSVLAGALAVGLAARWVGQQTDVKTNPVVVAARDLNLGDPLTPVMMQEVPWPVSAIPPGTFDGIKKLEGRVVRSSVVKGEPIMEAKLAPEGAKGGLPSVIPSGKRAISVKVNEVVGVAGFALPGSYVDVMVNIRDDRDKAVSKIVLQRILVLAVAQEANRDETKPKVVSAVTLEVTPEEAEKIDLARNIGTLSLVLRNPIDQKETDTAGIQRDTLLKQQKAAPTAAAAASTPRASTARARAPRPAPAGAVEVMRGVQKSNSEF